MKAIGLIFSSPLLLIYLFSLLFFCYFAELNGSFLFIVFYNTDVIFITIREVQRGVDGWIYKIRMAALRQNKSDI